jgi:hypothetical protein
MACTSPVTLSDKIEARPNASKAKELVKDRSELFAISTSPAEHIGATFPELALRDILSQVFQSDGMPMLISISNGATFNALGSEPVSVSVQTLVLPFRLDELAARVSSPLRRSAISLGNTARFGDVCVDFSSMEVSRSSGEQIALTAQEFKALRFFVSNPGRVISRDELLNQAWGYNHYPSTRTVDNHVLKLRQKLEIDPSRPKHFLTVHSVGYKFLP